MKELKAQDGSLWIMLSPRHQYRAALLPFLLQWKEELGMVIIFSGIAAAQQSSPFTEAESWGRTCHLLLSGRKPAIGRHAPELADSSDKALRAIFRSTSCCLRLSRHGPYSAGTFMRINWFTAIRGERSICGSWDFSFIILLYSLVGNFILRYQTSNFGLVNTFCQLIQWFGHEQARAADVRYCVLSFA